MSTGIGQTFLTAGLDVVRRNWGWFLALGILQIVLGMIALAASVLATVVSVGVFGWLLIIGGAMSIAHAFYERQWGGFIIDLLTGLLYAVVGFMIVSNPLESALSLTLLIALFLIIGGIFRIVEGIVWRLPHRGWVILNGVISLVLGILIWRQWPYSGLWVIGTFVGIEMIFYGWSLVMMGLAAKNLPGGATQAA